MECLIMACNSVLGIFIIPRLMQIPPNGNEKKNNQNAWHTEKSLKFLRRENHSRCNFDLIAPAVGQWKTFHLQLQGALARDFALESSCLL